MRKLRAHESDGDRYRFDFHTCRSCNGWAQFDTSQDAWYYGNWVNPIKREIISYAEGDITHTLCDSEAEFKAELQQMIQWHVDNGYNPKIDGMCSPPIIAELERLGFKDWMH